MEVDDVIGNVRDGFCVIGVVLLPNPSHLQIQDESLHHRVIPAIAFAAHAAKQTMPSQQHLVQATGVLRAPVRMHYLFRLRIALHDGHLKPRTDQRRR